MLQKRKVVNKMTLAQLKALNKMHSMAESKSKGQSCLKNGK